MNYSEMMAELKQSRVYPLYLLYGEEGYLVHQLAEAVIQAILPPEERAVSLIRLNQDAKPAELINLVETYPFMGGKNVICVHDSPLFRVRKGGVADSEADGAEVSYGEAKILRLFENMPAYSHVIFIAGDKVDKRRKVYKALEKYGAAVELAPLKAKDSRVWVQNRLAAKQMKLSAEALEYLLSVLSVMPQISLGFLDQEFEKLALYAAGKKIVDIRDLQEILSSVPEVSVFAMLDAITQKQLRQALELLGDQLASGEHPLRMVALLAREVRLLWQTAEMLKQGLDSRRIAERLGVPPFVGEKKVKQSQRFSVAALRQAALGLAAADCDLKLGRTDSSSLERIIIEMCM